MQKMLGKSPAKCANFMVQPILQCSTGKIGLDLPSSNLGNEKRGVYIMDQDATNGKLSKGHTAEALESVWNTTKDVLGRAGIDLEE